MKAEIVVLHAAVVAHDDVVVLIGKGNSDAICTDESA